MDTQEILSKIDLNSWFDLWHIHVDWDSEGETSWEKRKIYLKKLFDIYDTLSINIKKHHSNFQLWCLIDLEDSGSDSVYLHTKNPNEDNYPIRFKKDPGEFIWKYPLLEFIKDNNFEFFRDFEYRCVIAFKNDIGDNLL